MVDSSPEIQSLLEFILKEKFFEDQAYYYNEINNYLIKQFSTPPIQVYSIHSKEGHSTFKRKVWSHDNNFSHFSELDEINLGSLKKEKFPQSRCSKIS